MTLPADIARCGGRNEPQCDDCQRRNVEGLERVVWMSTPPDFAMRVNGDCTWRIEAAE